MVKATKSKNNASKKAKTRRGLWNTDRAAIQIYSHLVRDFRKSEGSSFMKGRIETIHRSIPDFRSIQDMEQGLVSVDRFKKTAQIQSFLKKYRFEHDYFSDAELHAKSLNDFMDDQLRLQQPLPLKLSGNMVLQRARLIARRILGNLPDEEIVSNARFGKKSSIGCPFRDAYIDVKLSMQEAMTGTKDSVSFFLNQVLPGDNILKDILQHHNLDANQEELNMTHLNLVVVPKTWKAYRLITPLTLLGLFYSYGIGRIIQSRLQDAGLDIQTLQNLHRRLVKEYSRTLKCATADLSKASDSITSELLNRVLPRPWYRALRKTFVRCLIIDDGKKVASASVLPMGNGATFPTETLVFYCILKAIAELSGRSGTVSVYGDDLIYPSSMHKYVVAAFGQFHLQLNMDKTFVSYPFRESCGADFYRGQDVRPYFLKGSTEYLTDVRYEAFLYKVYNGLTNRWDPLEIRDTLSWILSELAMVSHGILRVPPTFPDYSGIKVDTPYCKPLDYQSMLFANINVRFNNGTRWFEFNFLTENPNKRVVRMVAPYYWLSLQGLTDDVVDEYGRQAHLISRSSYRKTEMQLAQLPNAVKIKPKSSLSWRGTKYEMVWHYKKRKLVKRFTQYEAVVASKSQTSVSTATTKTGSVTDWI